MTQIVIASDATERSDVVVAKGIEFGRQIEAQVTVLHVVTEHRSEDLRLSLGTGHEFADAVVELLTDSISDQIERTAAGWPTSSMVLFGDVAATVLRQTESMEADYLVLGIRSRSRVGKFIMGSDVQQILLSTPCPVLGIPI